MSVRLPAHFSPHSSHLSHPHPQTKKESRRNLFLQDPHSKKAASYSPASHCSTIGASGLNFSVRNGKRWNPAAITTVIWLFDGLGTSKHNQDRNPSYESHKSTRGKDFGQLVALGFDVAVFTPAPYRRPRLGRPSMEFSSCGRLRT